MLLRIFGEAYKLLSSSLRSLFQSPVSSTLLAPNILLNILFSKRLNLWSSLTVRDRVSHPSKKRQNYSFIYILILKFLERIWEDERFWTECSKHTSGCLLLIYWWIWFWLVSIAPKFLDFCHIFERFISCHLHNLLNRTRTTDDAHRTETYCNTRAYPKVSGLAAWSENCKWHSFLPLGAVVSLFCGSV
jgi:hypothetical protein